MTKPAPDDDPIAGALKAPIDAPLLAEPGDTGGNGAGLETRGDGEGYERPPFPPGSPVKPLGMSADIAGSQKCYYLDANGQIVGLEAGNRHGKNSLIALYGPYSDWLEANYGQWSAPKREYNKDTKTWVVVKESELVGFDQAEASRALIEECARKGPFNPTGRMRGIGAHRKPGGGLVLHCGDKLLASTHKVDGSLKGWEWHDPGVLEGFVYPAAPPIPRPAVEPSDPRPAEKLLVGLLMTWPFKRKLLDPRLVLGAIGQSFIGGWLPWRAHVWITGGKGTGKSTLNGRDGVIHQLLGDGLFRTGNTSAAAVRQMLLNSTVPVMLDEIEASANNAKVKDVVEMARISSSGDTAHRGGQDHKAHEFTLRSNFWFSSILVPQLEPQDRSRLAICELDPLDKNAVPPNLTAFNLPAMGRALFRRMIDGLWRLEATKLKFHAALAASGHSARACDQFGTLLACADVLLHDWDTADGLPDDEDIAQWAGECRPDRMAEINEDTPDELACVQHITTSLQQARGGEEREMIATWIGKAVAAAIDPMFEGEGGGGLGKSSTRLQQIGLKVVNARRHKADGTRSARWGAQEFNSNEPGFLAVAGDHQGLSAIFQNTKWQGGVWKQSLARCEGAIAGVKVKFGHSSLRAVLVPLEHVLDETSLPNASKPDERAKWLAEQLEGAA